MAPADKPRPFNTASASSSTIFDSDLPRALNLSSQFTSGFSNSSFYNSPLSIPAFNSIVAVNHASTHNQPTMAANSPPTTHIANVTSNTHKSSPFSHSTSPADHRSAFCLPSSSPMAPPNKAHDGSKIDIHSLMSPPDVVMDSFNSGQRNSISNFKSTPSRSPPDAIVVSTAPNESKHVATAAKHPLPMSPPVSPYQQADNSTLDAPTTHAHAHGVKDPVLYPHDDNVSSPPQEPLFAAEIEDHRRIVDDHVRARSASIFGGVAPPRPEEYVLALSFRSQVMKHYNTNRAGWLRKERAFLQADRRAGGVAPIRYHAIMPAKPIAAKPARRSDKISKPNGAPRAIRTAQPNGSLSAGTARSAARRVSATPEPHRRVVAPNREDKDFNSLPDFCPSLDSLPNRVNSLKVDWKGQPIDLSGDPHANLLHPDEVLLAGNLRLDCATYLTSKRRIFERRLQCLRSGKEFRKTDAQQACKIDVNKASKLWTAYDKVGWLNAAWVQRFL